MDIQETVNQNYCVSLIFNKVLLMIFFYFYLNLHGVKYYYDSSPRETLEHRDQMEYL